MLRITKKCYVSLSFTLFALVPLALTGCAGSGQSAQAEKAERADHRTAILKQNDEILARLYRSSPLTRSLVRDAVGYATFSNIGVKIFLAGGGSGSGVAIHNHRGNANTKPIFMKMLQVQAGLGFGAKAFDLIFVFESERAFNDFVDSGWAFGGQATAAAKYKNRGGAYQGAVNIASGVWLYQLTEAGLAAEITVSGTKYSRDDDLNAAY